MLPSTGMPARLFNLRTSRSSSAPAACSCMDCMDNLHFPGSWFKLCFTRINGFEHPPPLWLADRKCATHFIQASKTHFVVNSSYRPRRSQLGSYNARSRDFHTSICGFTCFPESPRAICAALRIGHIWMGFQRVFPRAVS